MLNAVNVFNGNICAVEHRNYAAHVGRVNPHAHCLESDSSVHCARVNISY